MKTVVQTAIIGALLASSAPAFAAGNGADFWSAENWQFRLRAIDVSPSVESTVNIGGTVDVDNAIVPEFDITHYFTPNISAELILATSPHDVTYNNTTPLGDAMILPPTLTLQYHFTPDQKFSPYVGAGLNYSWFYGEDAAPGFTDLNLNGGLGYAAQVGFDYWLNNNWGVNLDVKRIWLNVDATLNNGAIQADVDLDPWVVGAGVSYRF